MTRRIRVLLVDDAATVRRMVAEAIADDPALEVAGTAAHGQMALERIEDLHPDVVLLDLEMPVMNGIDMLSALRVRHPLLPVLIYSSLTREGAAATMQALWLGANDVVAKPTGGLAATRLLLRTEVIPRLRELGGWQVPEPVVRAVVPAPAERPAPAGARAEVVAIGTSTGGPRALATLLGAIPPGLPAAMLIVQHMPAAFTGYFAQGLAARTGLPIREACDGDRLEPGRVLLAPGGRHTVVRRDGARAVVHLTDDEPEHGCRPSFDPLLRSLADTHGAAVLAVVLTGMGSDGLDGCEHVRAAGGGVLVQDRDSSVVWGMPGLVAEAGLAEAELPLERLAEVIQRRCGAVRGRKAA